MWLAQRIDALEGAEGGLVVGSGMAAVSAVLLGLCQTGDHVIGADQLYGRSLRMMSEDLPRLGIATSLVDACDPGAVAAAIRPETRIVLIEVVSNPTIRIADLDAVAEVCAERGVLLVVDNTFTTPLGIRPFEHGADIVLHSVTKLLAGHSDATLGWVAAKDPALAERMRIFAVTTGMTPSPFDCWLAERGLATFALRYARAQDTAQRLADFLSGAEGVKRVLYPTRPDHPGCGARPVAAERAGWSHGQFRDRGRARCGQCLCRGRHRHRICADPGRRGHDAVTSRLVLASGADGRGAGQDGGLRGVLPGLGGP